MIQDGIDIFLQLLFVTTLLLLLHRQMHHSVLILRELYERRREGLRQQHQDMQMVLHSRHTIPISVVVTTEQNEEDLKRTIDSLLQQSYPLFEIIVVYAADLKLATGDIGKQYQVKQVTRLFSKLLHSKSIQAVYRSKSHPQLTFLAKAGTEQWDHLNAGLNLARYRYVATVAAGVYLQNEALLKLVRPALFNPKAIVAVAAPVTLSDPMETAAETAKREKALPSSFWRGLQALQQQRHSLLNRFGWKQSHCFIAGKEAQVGRDTLVLWRRDFIVQVGGFAQGGAFEISVRLHEHSHRHQHRFQLVNLADAVGSAPASKQLRDFVQRKQQQTRNVREVLRRYRFMIFNRRYGLLGLWLLPMQWLESRLEPWLELSLFSLIPLGAAYGALSWSGWLALLILLIGTSMWHQLLTLWSLPQLTHTAKTAHLASLIAAALGEQAGFAQMNMAIRARLL